MIDTDRDSRRRKGIWAITTLTVLIMFAVGPNSSLAAEPCPNEAFRTGASAQLPDCRAYELVSPADTDGRVIIGPTSSLVYDQFPIELHSPVRDSVVYMTYGTAVRNVAEPNGSFDMYEAERSPTGWQTVRRITPSGAEAIVPDPGGLSVDHRYAFMHVGPLVYSSGGSMADAGSTGYLGNPDGSFELIGVGSLGIERLVQGRFISAGGAHVVFTTGGEWCEDNAGECQVLRLEPEAPPTRTSAIYDRAADGPTRVVSLLPGEVTPAAGEAAEYQGVSKDGSVVAFKVAGKLYVRVDNTVTREVASGDPTFAGLSEDGTKLFYVAEGNIFRFDVASGTTQQVNTSGDGEIVNVSADGSHVYFISPSLLDAPAGTEGQPNLYVWPGDEIDFVTTVAPSDLIRTSGTLPNYPALTNWTEWAVSPERGQTEFGVGPGSDSSRTTSDGTVLVFESRAQLTAHENQGHTEIYRYDADSGSLICVSCNPLAAGTSDAQLQNLRIVKPWTAIHNVSGDGSRVFFETAESLVSADVNGINDVYQWREDGGEGSVTLISSGKGVDYPPPFSGLGSPPQPNVIMGITPSGNDVTFISLDRLVAAGPGGGSPAIYDARVGGGFAETPVSPACSEADQCRGAAAGVAAPALLAPSPPAADSRNVKAHRHRCRRTQRGKRPARKKCSRHNHKKVRGR
jgi:hypothetical protein